MAFSKVPILVALLNVLVLLISLLHKFRPFVDYSAVGKSRTHKVPFFWLDLFALAREAEGQTAWLITGH